MLSFERNAADQSSTIVLLDVTAITASQSRKSHLEQQRASNIWFDFAGHCKIQIRVK